MLLSTPTTNDILEVIYTAETVVKPGDELVVHIKLLAFTSCKILGIEWEHPETMALSPEQPDMFPNTLEADQSFETKFVFLTRAGQEDYGDMHGHLTVSLLEGEEKTISWSAWISVLKYRVADDPEGLTDEQRDVLLGVANANNTNAQAFVADPFSFLKDFANIEATDEIIEMVSVDHEFHLEGIPVDKKTYTDIILKKKKFYGMEFEFEPVEYCPESDDRIDFDDAREIEFEVDDNA